AEQHRGARLTLRNLGRRQLGAVHLLEIDELARWPDDRECHTPVVLLGLGKCGSYDGLRLLVGDGCAIISERPGRRSSGWCRLLRQGRAGEHQNRGNTERDDAIKSHGPISNSIVAAS